LPQVVVGALSAFGWNDRVLALFNDLAELNNLPRPNDLTDQRVAPARVVRVERSFCLAICADGEERPLSAADLPAVGDWLAIDRTSVLHILPRWSALSRLDPDPAGAGAQVLAANVDLVFITAPADRLNPARVERELAVAWDSGAQPVVVLTKADLAVAGAARELAQRLVGADVMPVSAKTGLGLEELRAQLLGPKTAVFLGPSGAGKSTLTNALMGDGTFATAAVRDQDQRGRHTTTSRQLVALPGGGVLIDTPGLRSLGLAGDVSLADAFTDIGSLSRHCRFTDCRHGSEPGCAVTTAVSDGRLIPERLANFQKLEREIAADRRRYDPLARKAGPRLSKEYTKWAKINDKRKTSGRRADPKGSTAGGPQT
jgi:ribosome biogenesis GTPase / thiamine phosphate phosphatase